MSAPTLTGPELVDPDTIPDDATDVLDACMAYAAATDRVHAARIELGMALRSQATARETYTAAWTDYTTTHPTRTEPTP